MALRAPSAPMINAIHKRYLHRTGKLDRASFPSAAPLERMPAPGTNITLLIGGATPGVKTSYFPHSIRNDTILIIGSQAFLL